MPTLGLINLITIAEKEARARKRLSQSVKFADKLAVPAVLEHLKRHAKAFPSDRNKR
jgi:hypothetical protein